MGQVPAKLFPQPVAFGDYQVNTLRQAQAPDVIKQQQLPSLNFQTQAANPTQPQQIAQPAPVGKPAPRPMPIRSPMFGYNYR